MALVMLRFKRVLTTNISYFASSTRMASTIRQLSVEKFHEIFTTPEREKYQIVDVRGNHGHELTGFSITYVMLNAAEADELKTLNVVENAHLITHLPLSKHQEWLPDVSSILDPAKPTICIVRRDIYDSSHL